MVEKIRALMVTSQWILSQEIMCVLSSLILKLMEELHMGLVRVYASFKPWRRDHHGKDDWMINSPEEVLLLTSHSKMVLWLITKPSF